jgi:uncharacterized membrane protein
MYLIFSLLYAPLIVLLLGYFPLKTVAVGIVVFALVWLAVLRTTRLQAVLFPLFYLGVGIGAFVLENFVVLKLLPIMLSLAFLFFLIVGYFEHDSFILSFAKKIHRRSLSFKEEAYIQRSTLFWIGLAFINIALHGLVLLSQNDHYWVAYASFGWYLLFGLGALAQFLHRRFVFLKQG